MADSLIQNLPTLTAPALDDLGICADKSDGYVPKKLNNSALMQLILTQNAGFELNANGLKLKKSLNANGLKIEGLAAGENAGEAVRYGQIQDYIVDLGVVTPATPSLSDKGSHLRAAVQAISSPQGGFWAFYWCVDQVADTSISLTGGVPTASSGATVFLESAVENACNIIKDSGWVGKYIHVAARYRNLSSRSALSPTAHQQTSSPAWGDLVGSSLPGTVTEPTMSMAGNRLHINAKDAAGFGLSYVAEILFDNTANTSLAGNEAGLIHLYSKTPSFCYDIPITAASMSYAHARIHTIDTQGQKAVTATLHSAVVFDSNVISDNFVNYLAGRIANLLETAGSEAIVYKGN